MAQEEEKISRSRKKQLLARLKEQIQPKEGVDLSGCFFIMDSIFNENHEFCFDCSSIGRVLRRKTS